MAALASIGTLLGAGATIFAQKRAQEAQYNTQLAQAQANQSVEVQRQNQLIAQQQAEARTRQLQLARTIATSRARLAASGVAADDGSGAAITTGLTGDAAAAATASDAAFRAQLASGRASLLNPDASFTGFTRAGQSFGGALTNLLQ
jgi:multidrug efflux pump subunit AcrA (membrane-fusion protein)